MLRQQLFDAMEMVLPDKPNSSNQRYRRTALGQRWLETHPGISAG
ncbi:hypothetical protein NSMM_480065 [Nitrosomonas mobilis]|uniref:Uncharacterized protein n=1 Tax=Nitrosomonas mobilis TaxID=51642 RepID=A0A1G5SFU3_9PROT|nr:hypothetical protein NSMM_480065 [Nitrosomonas mobilis]